MYDPNYSGDPWFLFSSSFEGIDVAHVYNDEEPARFSRLRIRLDSSQCGLKSVKLRGVKAPLLCCPGVQYPLTQDSSEEELIMHTVYGEFLVPAIAEKKIKAGISLFSED